MKSYSDMIDIVESLSKYSKKYYLYASGWLSSLDFPDNNDDFEFVRKESFSCFPYLENLNEMVFMNDFVILEFDTKEEMNEIYFSIVGDDGNHSQFSFCTNEYDGNCRVYACTVYDGYCHNENT